MGIRALLAVRGVRAALARRMQGACDCLVFATSSRGVQRALEEQSQSFCEALAGCSPYSRALAGRSRNESGTLSVRGLLAGVCGVVLARSRGYRWALTGRSQGPRAGPLLGTRETLAGRSRKTCGAFVQCSRGPREARSTRGNSRNARGVFERHSGREALAARSRCWRVARKALEERIRNAREAVVGCSRSLARRLRGAHGMLAGRSRNGRSARAVFARRL